MENILENEFEEKEAEVKDEEINNDTFTFEKGQIFEWEYPPQAAEWCNENKCYIEEIEPLENGTRRFEIKEVPKPTEEEIRQQLNMLTLTAADVERAIYKAKGMDFDDIVEFVKSNPPEGLDIKALKIELKANNFYRGNPYVEQIGALLGYTSDDLDYLFKNKELPEKSLDDVIEATEEAKLYGDELTDFLNFTPKDIEKINNTAVTEESSDVKEKE